MPKRLLKHAGNRGVALAMLGVLWVLMAVGAAVSPLRRDQLLDEHFIPVWGRALLWGAPGLLAIAAAWWKKLDTDAWGWLMVPVVVRFVSFGFGWLCSIFAPLLGWGWMRDFYYPDGWRGCTSIAVFTVFIRVCAAGLDRAPVQREA